MNPPRSRDDRRHRGGQDRRVDGDQPGRDHDGDRGSAALGPEPDGFVAHVPPGCGPLDAQYTQKHPIHSHHRASASVIGSISRAADASAVDPTTVGTMRIRTKRALPAPDSPPRAEVTSDGDSRAPEVKIRVPHRLRRRARAYSSRVLLGGIVAELGTVTLYVALALFLSLGLDPIVSWLQRRGMARWARDPHRLRRRHRRVRRAHRDHRADRRSTETTNIVENWDDHRRDRAAAATSWRG